MVMGPQKFSEVTPSTWRYPDVHLSQLWSGPILAALPATQSILGSLLYIVWRHCHTISKVRSTVVRLVGTSGRTLARKTASSYSKSCELASHHPQGAFPSRSPGILDGGDRGMCAVVRLRTCLGGACCCGVSRGRRSNDRGRGVSSSADSDTSADSVLSLLSRKLSQSRLLCHARQIRALLGQPRWWESSSSPSRRLRVVRSRCWHSR